MGVLVSTLTFCTDSYGAGLVWKKCQPSTVNVCSWSSAASYVTPPGGSAKFSGNPIVAKKQLLQKRQVYLT